MAETRFFHLSAGAMVVLPTLDEALARGRQGGFVWVDCQQPTAEVLAELAGPFDLHPLAIEDCLDASQVPKIEDFPNNVFVLANAFQYASGELNSDEVDFFLGRNFLVTVSGREDGDRRPLSGIEKVVERELAAASQGPAFLMHVVLDRVVDASFEAIEAIEEDLDGSEETMLAAPAVFDPTELLRTRRVLLAMRKAVFHEREVLTRICRRDSPFFDEKVIHPFRDVHDHLTRSFELIETSRDVVTSLMEIYLSLLNNQMAQTANRTNRTMRRLTFITTVFMPMTLIAGIGGMSEWSMMTGPENWKLSYPLFLGGMAVLGVLSYLALRWLERQPPSDRS